MTRVSEETLLLLRRLRIQYRERPAIFRDLITITHIVDPPTSRADATKFGDPGHGPAALDLTPSEVAAQLGVTPDTIRKACRDGRLKATKPAGSREWHITPDAYVEYLSRAA